MVWNMPLESFLLYYVFFWVQFVLVVAYGVWWYFQGRTRVSDKT